MPAAKQQLKATSRNYPTGIRLCKTFKTVSHLALVCIATSTLASIHLITTVIATRTLLVSPLRSNMLTNINSARHTTKSKQITLSLATKGKRRSDGGWFCPSGEHRTPGLKFFPTTIYSPLVFMDASVPVIISVPHPFINKHSSVEIPRNHLLPLFKHLWFFLSSLFHHFQTTIKSPVSQLSLTHSGPVINLTLLWPDPSIQGHFSDLRNFPDHSLQVQVSQIFFILLITWECLFKKYTPGSAYSKITGVFHHHHSPEHGFQQPPTGLTVPLWESDGRASGEVAVHRRSQKIWG